MKKVWLGLVEVGFIVFLFYANLLMGEYEHMGGGLSRGIAWAIWNVFTAQNFAIALIAAIVGYGIIETLRKALQREARDQRP